ncbi:MAG: hypothetical protein EOP59_09045 [Sphingomonadales bacterium]|nr:MAG: hypothetical protein EOP59_09045 [Sphingomonadales bacterium]
MPAPDEDRVALRREAHDLKEQIEEFAERVEPVSGEAADVIGRARLALFEAWTILCTPPEEDEDD